MEPVGSAWKPHGRVQYRTECGDLVAVLPQTCRRGLHQLVGAYTAHVSCGDRAKSSSHRPTEEIVHLSCAACSAIPHPDHSWALRTGGLDPVRAVLDDRPYVELHKRLLDADAAEQARRDAHLAQRAAEREASGRRPPYQGPRL